jgi:iron complex transport system ATP-binding protein
MIELRNVSLTIAASDRKILKQISWRIGQGENWVLFGRNGAGKTKLLEIMTGYNFPSEGEVFRFGRPALGNDIRKSASASAMSALPCAKPFLPRNALSVVLSGLYATIGLYVEPCRPEKERAMALLDERGSPTAPLTSFRCSPTEKNRKY